MKCNLLPDVVVGKVFEKEISPDTGSQYCKQKDIKSRHVSAKSKKETCHNCDETGAYEYARIHHENIQNNQCDAAEIKRKFKRLPAFIVPVRSYEDKARQNGYKASSGKTCRLYLDHDG